MHHDSVIAHLDLTYSALFQSLRHGEKSERLQRFELKLCACSIKALNLSKHTSIMQYGINKMHVRPTHVQH